MVGGRSAPGLLLAGPLAADLESLTCAPDKDFVQVSGDPDPENVVLDAERQQLSPLGLDLPDRHLSIPENRGPVGEADLALLFAGREKEDGRHGRHPSADCQGSVASTAAGNLPSRSARAAAIHAASGTGGRPERGRDVTRSVE